MEYCLDALWVGLPYLPWLCLSDVAVAYAGEVHGLALCLTELVLVEKALHLVLDVLELCYGIIVDTEHLSGCWDD